MLRSAGLIGAASICTRTWLGPTDGNASVSTLTQRRQWYCHREGSYLSTSWGAPNLWYRTTLAVALEELAKPRAGAQRGADVPKERARSMTRVLVAAGWVLERTAEANVRPRRPCRGRLQQLKAATHPSSRTRAPTDAILVAIRCLAYEADSTQEIFQQKCRSRPQSRPWKNTR